MHGFTDFQLNLLSSWNTEAYTPNVQVEKVHSSYWHAYLVDHDVENGDIFKVPLCIYVYMYIYVYIYIYERTWSK